MAKTEPMEPSGDQVTAANAGQEMLQHFWDLASLDTEDRARAVGSLTTELLEAQAAHTAGSGDDARAAGDQQQQAAAPGGKGGDVATALRRCSPQMVYALKRLARGLASSRDGARQGYAAALCVLLKAAAGGGGGAAEGKQASKKQKQLQGGPAGWIDLPGALVLLETSLPVTGSMKGTDQRDALLGRVFGLAAIARSGLAARSAADAARVADAITALSARKSFLREAGAAALLELMEGLPPGGVALDAVVDASPGLRSLLLAPAASATPEALLLALRLWGRLPPALRSRCELLPAGAPPPPPAFWQDPASVDRCDVEAAAAALFARGHLQALGPALAASSAAAPRLHDAWGCLLALLLPGFVASGKARGGGAAAAPQRGRADPALLSVFWSGAVEGPLLSSPSHERRALALTLLQLLLPWLTPEAVPVVLGGRLVGLLAVALRDKTSYLHASAKRCAERIATLGERSGGGSAGAPSGAEGELRLALAAALQSGAGGGAGFDGASHSKTVSRLLAGLDAGGVESYVHRLLAAFQSPRTAAAGDASGDASGSDSDEEEEGGARGGPADADTARCRSVEQLCTALRFPAASDALVTRGLGVLAAAAFLDVSPGAADAAAGGDGGKKGKKKSKGTGAAEGGSSVDAAAALRVMEGAAEVELSQRVRGVCAARLVTLIHAAAHKQQQQQQQAGGDKQDKDKQQGGSKKERAAAAAANATAAAEASRTRQEALLSSVLSLLERSQGVEGVALAQPLPPAAEASLGGLRDLCAALQPLAAAAPAAAGSSGSADGARRARARALLHLARLMQLQLLSDPAGFDVRLVPDLQRVAAEGAGAAGLDLAAPGSGAEESDVEGGSDEDGPEGPTHWADLLLDVLLALLSGTPDGGVAGGLPSAPLREAAEALFRASAEELTAAGLQDLLRVLGQRADEAGLLQEGDEEEDSEEEVEEGGSSSEEEEEEEEEEEGSSDADHAPPAAKGKQAVANGSGAKRPREDEGEEEDESSDEGMDDEAMLRLDAQLGAYVKSMLQRGGSSARERTAALRNLQLRAAALFEEWTRRCPRSPLAADAAAPLLRALATAARPGGSQPLAERLRSLAANRLAKCRPDLAAAAAGSGGEEGSETDALRAALRSSLYYASRERDARVAGAAAAVFTMLLAAASAPTASPAARAAAAEFAAAAAADVTGKKKSRLGRAAVSEMLTRAPAAAAGEGLAPGGESALAVLARAAVSGRSEFVRAEAAELLSAALSKAPADAAGPALRRLQADRPGALAAALVAAVQGPFKTTERHAAAAKAAVSVVLAARKLLPAGGRLGELLGPDALTGMAKAVAAVRTLGVPPRVEAQLARLVEAAGMQQLVATSAARPDPARLAALKKQRAALAAKPAGAKPGKGGAAGTEHGAGKKAAAAAAGGEDEEMEEGGSSSGEEEEEEEDSSGGDEAMSDGGDSSEEEEEEQRRPQKGKQQQQQQPQRQKQGGKPGKQQGARGGQKQHKKHTKG